MDYDVKKGRLGDFVFCWWRQLCRLSVVQRQQREILRLRAKGVRHTEDVLRGSIGGLSILIILRRRWPMI